MSISSQKIEISHKTVIFTVAFLILLAVLYEVRSVILQIYVAFIIMTGLNPIVERLTRFKVPRTLAVAVVYLFLIGGFIVFLAGIIPPLVDQTSTMVSRFPDIVASLGVPTIAGENLLEEINNLGSIPGDVLRVSLSVFSNLLSVVAILVLSFYLLLARRNLDDHIAIFFGSDNKDKVRNFIDKLETRLGGWVNGQLTLMLIIGFMTYIGLRILDIHYALPLALLAGLFEIVPTIGPIISAIPAVIIALSVSPITALAVIALYFLIQTAENHLIVPNVMQRSVGLNPLITLIILAIGLKLGGAIGALLGVPVFLTLQIMMQEFIGLRSISKE